MQDGPTYFNDLLDHYIRADQVAENPTGPAPTLNGRFDADQGEMTFLSRTGWKQNRHVGVE
ncbi:hypothetical protein [Burkholderia plantarii]|uniref:hypothetical protein n=1 Tax=Burkholderia plantarii TaxID=41899 RepID=UPI000F4F92C9|nr:hypothetical protein [Burkholderia plantarii]